VECLCFCRGGLCISRFESDPLSHLVSSFLALSRSSPNRAGDAQKWATSVQFLDVYFHGAVFRGQSFGHIGRSVRA
jgi:hypothetical protein